MTLPATAKQLDVLRLIHRTIQRRGSPPTHRELSKALGYRAQNTAVCHIRALERKGLITVPHRAHRARIITSAGRAALGLPVSVLLPSRCGRCQTEPFDASPPCFGCREVSS